jgi:hypothetical protein
MQDDTMVYIITPLSQGSFFASMQEPHIPFEIDYLSLRAQGTRVFLSFLLPGPSRRSPISRWTICFGLFPLSEQPMRAQESAPLVSVASCASFDQLWTQSHILLTTSRDE